MKSDKILKLTSAEIVDHAADLYFDAKFSELTVFAANYDVPRFWTTKADEISRGLITMGLDEQMLIRYVEFLNENCTLDIVRNTFLLQAKPRDRSIIVQITVSKKHITEGGRVAEAVSVLNMERFNVFNTEEQKLLSCVGVAILVDTYADDGFDEDEFECDDPEECDCPDCTIRREEERGGPIIEEEEDGDDDADEESGIVKNGLH